MRMSRLAAGLATAGLLAATPVLVGAGPASAATVGSTVNVDALDHSSVTYGDKLYFSGQVTTPNGDTPDNGIVSLQISTPANPTYTTIATDDDVYFSFSDVKAISNANYQVVYAGGTEYNSTTNGTDAVTGSTSAPIPVSVERKVKLHTDGLKVIGKIRPSGKQKVKILRKEGKKYTLYRKFKTSKSGQFTFRAPKRNGFQFELVIPANAQFAATKAKYHVTVF